MKAPILKNAVAISDYVHAFMHSKMATGTPRLTADEICLSLRAKYPEKFKKSTPASVLKVLDTLSKEGSVTDTGMTKAGENGKPTPLWALSSTKKK